MSALSGTLSDAQLDRYARHIVLHPIGGAGQRKLLAARALVIGAGGIGCPAIQYLAAAGMGHLTIVDNDKVALSNLQRQVLFGVDDVGKGKAGCAAAAVRSLNPDVTVAQVEQRIGADGFPDDPAAFFADFDVVIDGSDNYATRLFVSDHVTRVRVPLVSAAIGQFQGQLGVFRGWEADQPCYRCFVGDAFDADDCDNCAELGVLGAMTGLMGSFAAMEAIRVVTGFGDGAAGRLHLFDGLAPAMRAIRLAKDPACAACGSAQLESTS